MYRLTEKENARLPLFKELIGDVLIGLAEEDPRILVFDADLANASGLQKFAARFPERFVDCGIQEANMVGMAAASSESGAVPFAHTFAAFAGRKCVDQVFLAACYSQLNLKLIGSDPGITAATNGGTHQAMEDMGLFMAYPDITLLEPSDGVQYAYLLRLMKETYGVCYLRANRKCEKQIYEEGSSFAFGKGCLLREGNDATIIASGIEVGEARKAAALLEKEGISVRVIDMFCWKPLDRELIIESAQKTGAIVVAENHATASGLGSAVANVVVQECPVPMRFIGVRERFGEVGSIPYLQKKFEMDDESIARQVREVLKQK